MLKFYYICVNIYRNIMHTKIKNNMLFETKVTCRILKSSYMLYLSLRRSIKICLMRSIMTHDSDLEMEFLRNVFVIGIFISIFY